MKVAILTMFNGLSNTYSLVNVVREQLSMLLDDDIQVRMLVSEHCLDSERTGIFADKRIEWIKVVNSKNNVPFHWKTYTSINDKINDNFYDEARVISDDFVKYLKDVDICIMHDILYQGVHLVHNVAIRTAQKKLPQVKFISFMHSAPIKHIEASYPINCLYKEMPNTTYVYPTECGLKGVSKQYNTDINNCICINNSIDITIGMNPEIKKIESYIDLYESEIIIVYPARLNMAKKFHIVALMAGYIKKYTKKTVSVIFCDFKSADINPKTYKWLITDIGLKNGLDSNNIIFTSDCGFENGVKRETVLDLFSLSNLFICPSYSESFGLTVIEAASRGNYIVLNEAVPALLEIGSNIKAYFMRWAAKNYDFDTVEKYYPSERLYYIENVQKIIKNMSENSVITAKTLSRIRYSNKWIYNNQLKPLLKQLMSRRN